MTEPFDAQRFNTAIFLGRSIYDWTRMRGDHGQRPSSVELGMAREARLLLAQGWAVGYFAEETVERWLRSTESFARGPLTRESDYDKLPAFLESDQLLDIAPDIDEESGRQAAFASLLNRMILVPGVGLDRDRTGFAGSLLFDSDRGWQQQMDRAFEAVSLLTDWAARPDELISPARMASNWADLGFDFLRQAIDCLQLATGVPHWNQDVRFQDQMLSIWSSATEFSRTISKIFRYETLDLAGFALGTRETVTRPNSELIRLLALSRLYGVLASGLRGDESLSSLRQFAAMLPAASEGVIGYAAGPGLEWTSCLWRIAPQDERSIARLTGLMEIVELYVHQAGRRMEQLIQLFPGSL